MLNRILSFVQIGVVVVGFAIAYGKISQHQQELSSQITDLQKRIDVLDQRVYDLQREVSHRMIDKK